MLFLGMANAYVMRTNMSVAIVAMVNHTAINSDHDDVVDDECPDQNLTLVVSEPALKAAPTEVNLGALNIYNYILLPYRKMVKTATSNGAPVYRATYYHHSSTVMC